MAARSLAEAIVAEARRWIGTPYHHQASARGAGCDCAGLVLGVWRAVIGPWPEELPPYTPDWAEASGEELVRDMARRHMAEIGLAAARPGDVLVFRMLRHGSAKHCAILSGPDGRVPFRSEDRNGCPTMIHAFSGHKVREEHLSPAWTRRLAHVFRFPERA